MSQSPPEERVIIVNTVRRRDVRDAQLVLASAGIPNQIVQRAGRWRLSVPAAHGEAAMAEWEAFRADNPDAPENAATRTRLFQGATAGVIAYAVVIVSIAAVSASPESREIWHSIGCMRAGDVMGGQVWRTITALTLHADAGHLLSNLAFGSVYGFLAGRIVGGGVAWATIVAAGGLGNGLNALMRDADYSSIGASTAVFAALGMMVAHAIRPAFVDQTDASGEPTRVEITKSRWRRWAPVIGGVVMLAMTGVEGERTDVGAHVLGFFAGGLLGYVAVRLPETWLADTRCQIVAGVLVMTVVIVAWIAAVATAG